MAVSTSSKHITTYGPTGTYYCKFLGFFIGVVKHGSAQHESTYTATPLGMLFCVGNGMENLEVNRPDSN